MRCDRGLPSPGWNRISDTTKQALRASGSNTLPAVRVDGRTIGDSENIIRHFESSPESSLDSFLTKDQEADKLMLWRLMNHSIYQFMVAERWLHPDVYPVFAETFRDMVLPRPLDPPWPLFKPVIAHRVRGKTLKSISHLTSD
ncbi:MAG: hypothetical protein GY910_26050 [bacterium]|nr:hypothetical protein [bacterium]